MIGDNLKSLRVKNKESQSSLAEKLGISVNYLSQLENNRKKPSLKLIEKMANIYQCSVSSLIETDRLKSDLRQVIDKEGLERVIATLNELLEEHK